MRFNGLLQRVSIRNAYMLLFASQIVNIGFGLLAIFITLLADEIKLRPLEIGVIISIFMVARAISAAIMPDISDKIGRKIILIISLIFYATSTALLGFARTFFTLFILRVVEGAAAGAVFPTAEALLVDSVPIKDRGAWMGKYFTTFNFGFIIGPALGGILFTFGQSVLLLDTLTAFSIPFLFTGLLGFLSLISVILFVEDIMTKDSFDELIRKIESLSSNDWEYQTAFKWGGKMPVSVSSLFDYRYKGEGHEGGHAKQIKEYFKNVILL